MTRKPRSVGLRDASDTGGRAVLQAPCKQAAALLARRPSTPCFFKWAAADLNRGPAD